MMSATNFHSSFDGWPFAEFASSLGANNLAMLVAFLDDTGTHKTSTAAGVFGLVSTSDELARLDDSWKQCLKSAGLSWFHAVDCDYRKNEFSNREQPDRYAIWKKLIEIIGSHSVIMVGAAVVRSDWNQVLTPQEKSYFGGDPLYFCFEHCMQQLSKWSKEHGGGDPVSIVFSQQQQYQGMVEKLFHFYSRSLRFSNLGSFSLGDPRCVIPLQAADLVAYESYQYMRALDEAREMRWQLRQLLDSGVESIAQFHDANTLRMLMAEGPTKLI